MTRGRAKMVWIEGIEIAAHTACARDDKIAGMVGMRGERNKVQRTRDKENWIPHQVRDDRLA